ncbi:MAG: single-stranded DNA-binding protein [Pseudobdellovibrionaceae bacterium]|nr:single-stranded DNA-binding protein [Pseudobdellovibrionaceae bacterium]
MTATNLCKFHGRIVRKSELKSADGKNPAVNVTIAVTSRAINGSGESYERTDFAQVVFWDDLAAEALAYGRNAVITVEARMQTRSYKAENVKRYITEFVALAILPQATKAKKGA